VSSKLFVGGLAWATRDETLKAHFEQSGEVTDAKVIMERDTGRSRGFGFVTFADAETATKARDALNGSDLDGRSIRVDSATERPDRGGRDGGGGGGGGRDGGGGGGGGRW
jgi:cold-inducible RNA-binding protein